MSFVDNSGMGFCMILVIIRFPDRNQVGVWYATMRASGFQAPRMRITNTCGPLPKTLIDQSAGVECDQKGAFCSRRKVGF